TPRSMKPSVSHAFCISRKWRVILPSTRAKTNRMSRPGALRVGRRKGDPIHGWIVLDKPTGMTAATAVAKVKRVFNAAKAGHAGTLDPLATGVLPIALG